MAICEVIWGSKNEVLNHGLQRLRFNRPKNRTQIEGLSGSNLASQIDPWRSLSSTWVCKRSKSSGVSEKSLGAVDLRPKKKCCPFRPFLKRANGFGADLKAACWAFRKQNAWNLWSLLMTNPSGTRCRWFSRSMPLQFNSSSTRNYCMRLNFSLKRFTKLLRQYSTKPTVFFSSIWPISTGLGLLIFFTCTKL